MDEWHSERIRSPAAPMIFARYRLNYSNFEEFIGMKALRDTLNKEKQCLKGFIARMYLNIDNYDLSKFILCLSTHFFKVSGGCYEHSVL